MDTSRFHSAVGVLERGGWYPRRLSRAVAELEAALSAHGEASWEAREKLKLAQFALDATLEAFHQSAEGTVFALMQWEGSWYTARIRKLHQLAGAASALMSRKPRPPRLPPPGPPEHRKAVAYP